MGWAGYRVRQYGSSDDEGVHGRRTSDACFRSFVIAPPPARCRLSISMPVNRPSSGATLESSPTRPWGSSTSICSTTNARWGYNYLDQRGATPDWRERDDACDGHHWFHLDTGGRPLRYKVENSWGDPAGDKGFFAMADRWVDE